MKKNASFEEMKKDMIERQVKEWKLLDKRDQQEKEAILRKNAKATKCN